MAKTSKPTADTVEQKSHDAVNVDDDHLTLVSFSHLDRKKLLRKMDLRLIPMLTVLYLLSFLDRGNIGNAKIEGLAEDLNLTGSQYNWCLTAFFFTYCAFEVPSNMMLKKMRPSIWLPSLMVAWGLVTTLMGLVHNYAGLLSARIFLGVAEAGLFPGVVYYNTMWYCRYEVQVRQAYFFSAASIAGAFSGLLAYGISFMDGVAGLHGWRWIFILEGLLTVLVAIAAFFLIHDSPETAKFLTPEERRFVAFRLRYDGQLDEDSGRVRRRVAQNDDAKFRWEYVRAAFTDWQIWLNILVFWGYACPLYSISLFLPTIVKGLGYRSVDAQLLTIPVYVAASIFTIIVAYFADKIQRRSPFIVAALVIQLVGFIMCLTDNSSTGLTYAGIFIAACAIYPTHPSNITWLSNNLAGSYKRAIGMGIQISLGSMSGAMASNFYRAADGPRFVLGHALCISFIAVGIIAALVMAYTYRTIDKKREARLQAGQDEAFTSEQLSALGDRAVTFRYTL